MAMIREGMLPHQDFNLRIILRDFSAAALAIGHSASACRAAVVG
jgi:hypothetical protein